VNEHEQSGGPHPQPGPNPSAEQPEVIVDDSGAQPTYANFCRVMATPEEVILDFGLNSQPFTEGRQVVKANHRIVMTPYTARRLLAALAMTIQRHEQTFGSIELDVNRRVNTPQPRFVPTEDRVPAGQPQPVRLR
jgi:hypothetical protein